MNIYEKRGESWQTQEVLPAHVMEHTESWGQLTLLKKPPLPWALYRTDTKSIDLSWYVQVLQVTSSSYFNGDCYVHGIVHELGYLKSISFWLDAVYRLFFFPATNVAVLTETGSAEVRWLPSLPSSHYSPCFDLAAGVAPSMSLHDHYMDFRFASQRRRSWHDLDS